MSIKLEDVTKKVGKNELLKSVSLCLEEGKIYGIVGKNGSGKTMLLKTLSKLIIPSAGMVDMPYDNIGILIENAEMYPYFTGYENLEYLASINGKIGRREIEENMSLLELDIHSRKKTCEYSLGMRQKLALIQAWMEEPDVLLLDEPTNALDKHSIEIVHQRLRNMAKQGKIIVVTSHSPYDIERLCDYLLYMEEGKLLKIVENKKKGEEVHEDNFVE